MSLRTLHRVTADSAMQSESRAVPAQSLQASNQPRGAGQPDSGQGTLTGFDILQRSPLPANSVMIPTASMKRRFRDSDRPGVPTGTTISARALFNRLYQEKMGRDSEPMENGYPIYTTMANAIKDDIRSFLYHRLGIERGTRTYSSVREDFLSQIMNLKRRLLETYPVLSAAQGGWVLNEFLKEAIQRDKKAAAEARKRENKKKNVIFAEETHATHANDQDTSPFPTGGDCLVSEEHNKSVNAKSGLQDSNGCGAEVEHCEIVSPVVTKCTHVHKPLTAFDKDGGNDSEYDNNDGDDMPESDIESAVHELDIDIEAYDGDITAPNLCLQSVEPSMMQGRAATQAQVNNRNTKRSGQPVTNTISRKRIGTKANTGDGNRSKIPFRLRSNLGKKKPRRAPRRMLVSHIETDDGHDGSGTHAQNTCGRLLTSGTGTSLRGSRKFHHKNPRKMSIQAERPTERDG